jgi:hypothetical protein
MQGIKIFDPAWSPVIRRTSRTQFLILVNIPLLPLQTPPDRLRFRRTMTGDPTLSAKCARGRPEQLIEFRYSAGYSSSPPQIFRAVIDPDQKDWVKKSPLIEFAINSSINSATGLVPFKINNGYMPIMMKEVKDSERTPSGV